MRSRQRGGKRMEKKFPESHVALSRAVDYQGREGLSTHLIAVLAGSLGAKHVHQHPPGVLYIQDAWSPPQTY